MKTIKLVAIAALMINWCPNDD